VEPPRTPVLFSQVSKKCTDPDLSLLYILTLGTSWYSKFTRKNNFFEQVKSLTLTKSLGYPSIPLPRLTMQNILNLPLLHYAISINAFSKFALIRRFFRKTRFWGWKGAGIQNKARTWKRGSKCSVEPQNAQLFQYRVRGSFCRAPEFFLSFFLWFGRPKPIGLTNSHNQSL